MDFIEKFEFNCQHIIDVVSFYIDNCGRLLFVFENIKGVL